MRSVSESAAAEVRGGGVLGAATPSAVAAGGRSGGVLGAAEVWGRGVLGVATTSLAEGLARERLACSTSRLVMRPSCAATAPRSMPASRASARAADRKSTRLNSSHVKISYAVFCLKKKKKINKTLQITL